MKDISFDLEIFEGPLDLLLHLVHKNKVSIYDIPIAKITEQYFAYMEQSQALDIELSGDFLVMAAQLLYIKSKMLLPAPEEEEEDPRAELAEALAEYKRYKAAASELDVLQHFSDNLFFKAPEALDLPKTAPELFEMPPDALVEALKKALLRHEFKKPVSPQVFRGILRGRQISVKSRCRYVLKLFQTKKRLDFYDIFREAKDRPEIVATFLAVLWLIQEKKLAVKEQRGRVICVKSGEEDGENAD